MAAHEIDSAGHPVAQVYFVRKVRKNVCFVSNPSLRKGAAQR